MMTIKMTDVNFRQTVKEGLTLVDFYATWCGPCKMLGPVLEELDQELQGKVKIAKVDVDENPMLSGQFQVMSVPTMILFKDGQAIEKISGFQPKPVLKQYLMSKFGK
jgi:thioredoxin 1